MSSLVFHVITREERRERELGENDEAATRSMSFVKKIGQAQNDRFATIGKMDRPELRGADSQMARHYQASPKP